MNNIKKIGMTALAASLASTSAFAGAVTVSGGASINYGIYSSSQLNRAASWTMGDNLIFSGSGTLENGLNVSLSMEIDQSRGSSTNPFEAQSVTVSRDDLGALTFSGLDGSSAGDSIAKTAAGNIWDNFDSAIGSATTGVDRLTGGATDNSFFYTSPALIEGLNVIASYSPHTTTLDGSIGYGVKYAGVAGLTANIARQDVEGSTSSLDGESTTLKIAYAVGPLTLTASDNDYKTGNGTASAAAAGTANTGQKTRSYALAYTISEALSINVGTETIDAPQGEDAEYQTIGASYTMGGMTISASLQDADNTNHSTAAANDQEYFTTGISFAF